DNCHDRHGTTYRFLLKLGPPRICQQCHVAMRHPGSPGAAGSVFLFGHSCTNCHANIHGSNTPRGPFFSRFGRHTESEETAMKAHRSRTLLGSLILGGALLAALPSIARAQMTLGSLSVHGAAAVGVYPQPVPNTNVAKYREYTDLAQQVIAPEL